MAIYRRKTTNYRRIWEQANNQKIPKDDRGRSYEIHHIDGNHNNNDPSNLQLVTIEEHYEIHYAQGDWHACFKISKRMKMTPEETSELASELGKKSALKRVADGTHNFLGPESNLKRVADGTHPFLGENNPSRRKSANDTHHWMGPSANQEMLAKGLHSSQKQWECEHCGKIGKNTMNYTKWHGNNCRSNLANLQNQQGKAYRASLW